MIRKELISEAVHRFADELTTNRFFAGFFRSDSNLELIFTQIEQFLHKHMGCSVAEVDNDICIFLGKRHVALNVPLHNVLTFLEVIKSELTETCSVEHTDETGLSECKGTCSKTLDHIKNYIAKGYLEETVANFTGFDASYFSVLSHSRISSIILHWIMQVNDCVLNGDLAENLKLDHCECELSHLLDTPFMQAVFNDDNDLVNFSRLHEELHNITSSLFFFIQKRDYAQAYILYIDFLDKSRNLLNEYHDKLNFFFQRAEFNFEFYVKKMLDQGKTVYVATINMKNMKHINRLWGTYNGDFLIDRAQLFIDRTFGLFNRSSLFIKTKDAEFRIALVKNDEYPIAKLKGFLNTLKGSTVYRENFVHAIEFYHSVFELSKEHMDEMVSVDLLIQHAVEESKMVKSASCTYLGDEVLGLVEKSKFGIKSFEIMKDAFNNNSFYAHFQPIYHSDGKTLSHIETLARICEGEICINAGAFIDTIIEMNRVEDLDSIILGRLLDDIERIKKLNVPLFINVNPKSLHSTYYVEILGSFLQAAAMHGVEICLEITEQSIFESIDLVKDIKNRFNVAFAIDDFGTGYSNFRVVADLANAGLVKYLKIDGSLIKDINSSTVLRDIVSYIQNIAGALGLNTVAEFIDNEDVLKTVHSLGINYAQGYHLGKPMSIDDLEKHIS